MSERKVLEVSDEMLVIPITVPWLVACRTLPSAPGLKRSASGPTIRAGTIGDAPRAWLAAGSCDAIGVYQNLPPEAQRYDLIQQSRVSSQTSISSSWNHLLS